ncbi:hypothetical protein AcdelDRAFT_4167 [Acidovorax delafieldii 2AN]|uniref:Uncharacterized protein n=1 Tax=Acidovorax delafieldii 2AN TaxID=573060 RepID=C5TB87_ACIDE|nr:hypothetical protein [Acidovorax delafieldii]EER58261.1 hypothetical protein AcdelDRAFT_4167 [Acidovorax delafieldii 2AN]
MSSLALPSASIASVTAGMGLGDCAAAANAAGVNGACPLSESLPTRPVAEAAYWPCERLNAFILKMAAHGQCVNAAMMLGHRPYALEQLARARALGDPDLAGLAARLQAYFDATPSGSARA